MYETNTNQSTSFLSGLVPYAIRSKVTLHLGHQEVEPEEWGKYLYLTTNEAEVSIEEGYAKYGIPIEHVTDNCFRVKIDESTYMNIVYPFLMGKYTQIDPKYIESTFRGKRIGSYMQEQLQ